MPPSAFLRALQSILLSLLSHSGRTCIYTSNAQITQDSRGRSLHVSNRALFKRRCGEEIRRKKEKKKANWERIGALWHPQEANASLQLCHFSPHRHPKCCSCEVMSVVMVTVCEPGIAHPPTSPPPVASFGSRREINR